MTNQFALSLLISIVWLVTYASAFKPMWKQSAPTKYSIIRKFTADATIPIDNLKATLMKAYPAVLPIFAFPSLASASDGAQTVVAIPIVISVLTIFPFIYYAQQLKPKERTVKQIEVDPVTRIPTNKSNESKGSVAQAKATKKK